MKPADLSPNGLVRTPIFWVLAGLVVLGLYQLSSGGIRPNADPIEERAKCIDATKRSTSESENSRRLVITHCVNEGYLTEAEATGWPPAVR